MKRKVLMMIFAVSIILAGCSGKDAEPPRGTSSEPVAEGCVWETGYQSLYCVFIELRKISSQTTDRKSHGVGNQMRRRSKEKPVYKSEEEQK